MFLVRQHARGNLESKQLGQEILLRLQIVSSVISARHVINERQHEMLKRDDQPIPLPPGETICAPVSSLPVSAPSTPESTGTPASFSHHLLRHEIRVWTRDLLIAIGLALIIIVFLYQPVKVEGTSMAPLLSDQERIFINKFVYRFESIHRGDVVVFWYPLDRSKSFIKRVVGLPGEMVEIRRGVLILERADGPRALRAGAVCRRHGLRPQEVPKEVIL